MNYPGPKIASLPLPSAREQNMGRLLLEQGKLTPADAERAVRLQKDEKIRFGEAAVLLGLVSEADVQQVLARQFDYAYLQPGQGTFPPELVAAYQPFSAQVEMLRAVRSQLMLRWLAAGRKGLVIASINPGEGASLLAANLAVVFSQLGEQTLLIDANLRQPRQHRIFDLEGKQGLSDLLAGRTGIDSIVRIDAFDGLSVLPAGTLPPNPQELINRTTFTALHDAVDDRFDVILYDVPAFATSADALAMASRIGGVLLVARKNHTRLADVDAVADQLKRIGAEVIGSVLVDC